MSLAGASFSQDLLVSLRRLSDQELASQLKGVAAQERADAALVVAHLAELETRELHLQSGYSSLFVYCREALALSEHDAYNHIEVARAARRFPVVLELVAAGSLNLTTVRLLAPHLTPENHVAVLESAFGKRRAEVEALVARLAPFPEAPSFVRKLPPPRATPAVAWNGQSFTPVVAVARAGAGAPAPPVAPAAPPEGAAVPPSAVPAVFVVAPRPGPSGDVTPLAPDRYRLQVTIGEATLEKLRLAKDMLRHAIPSGDDAAIVDRAFTALLVDLARTRFSAAANPASARPAAPGSRHVPAEVKRAVWLRDLGRCAYVSGDGRRCNERAFVEFHHIKPYAAGGEATVDNIQLRCRAHNGYEARRFFDAPSGSP